MESGGKIVLRPFGVLSLIAGVTGCVAASPDGYGTRQYRHTNMAPAITR
jgi:hypothetical protein